MAEGGELKVTSREPAFTQAPQDNFLFFHFFHVMWEQSGTLFGPWSSIPCCLTSWLVLGEMAAINYNSVWTGKLGTTEPGLQTLPGG